MKKKDSSSITASGHLRANILRMQASQDSVYPEITGIGAFPVSGNQPVTGIGAFPVSGNQPVTSIGAFPVSGNQPVTVAKSSTINFHSSTLHINTELSFKYNNITD
ncbi:MAG: hypothetical protein LBS80_03150 [Tannerella sp.]|jgi:hypothetical protein|nr:hypothetical protein [Tannerella sp.]